LYEAETSTRLSYRELATRLKARGYSIDPAALSRMDYALETLYPCLPATFQAGLGQTHVEKLKRVENGLVTYLTAKQRDAQAIETARQWYLGCLARHDTSTLPFNFDGLQGDITAYLAEVCAESPAQVRADLLLIDRTGAPGQDAPVPDLLTVRPVTTGRSDTPHLQAVDTVEPETLEPSTPTAREDDTGAEDLHGPSDEPPNPLVELDKSRPRATEVSAPSSSLPQDVKSLRARLWTLATQLAQSHDFANCIRLCKQGCGFTVDLPEVPLFDKGYPSTAIEAERLMLWWMLTALADQWPYGPDDTPSLPALEDARIGPALLAAAAEDQTALAGMLEPRVGFPPSLDLAARQLFAILPDRDYQRLLQVMEARRLLQTHCRRLGKANVWLL
jgi:hypothetical protein